LLCLFKYLLKGEKIIKKTIPPPKRLKPPFESVYDNEEGWFFVDPNNNNFVVGPYLSKKDADMARKDMYLNYQINWKNIGPIMLELDDEV
jgi:hypothetical protein